MKNSSNYVVPFRRKREGRTNYKKRLLLLKSRKPRLVVRRSNRYVLAQVVLFDNKGDKVVVSFDSKKLKDLGWNYSFNSVPASYLTGLMIGKLALKKGVNEAILDIGLQEKTVGNRIFSLVKGAVDAGLNIPVDPEILPSEDRVLGKHIVEYYKMLKDNGSNHFSKYKDVENIPKLVEQIKDKILKM